MSAREVIAEELERYTVSPGIRAEGVIAALRAHGYVILSPDEVRELADGLQCSISSMAAECEGNHRIALNTLDRAIRSLKGGHDVA